MIRVVMRATLMSAAVAMLAGPAQAQYGGWGGWGGSSTLAEGYGRGMGVTAAGAGQYNEQTAAGPLDQRQHRDAVEPVHV